MIFAPDRRVYFGSVNRYLSPKQSSTFNKKRFLDSFFEEFPIQKFPGENGGVVWCGVWYCGKSWALQCHEGKVISHYEDWLPLNKMLDWAAASKNDPLIFSSESMNASTALHYTDGWLCSRWLHRSRLLYILHVEDNEGLPWWDKKICRDLKWGEIRWNITGSLGSGSVLLWEIVKTNIPEHSSRLGAVWLWLG